MLKKCVAIGPRGLGAASGGGSGSMWRTETARLFNFSFNSSSGRDSSLWVLEGWAEIQQWQINWTARYFVWLSDVFVGFYGASQFHLLSDVSHILKSNYRDMLI